MFEVKITIAAPELAAAINNLAAAIGGTKIQPQAPAASVSTNTQSAAPVPNAPPAVTSANGAATNAPYTAGTPALAQILQPPATPTVPAPCPSPIMTAPPSAQQVFPFNQQTAPVPTPGVPLALPPQYTIDQIMAAGTSLMDAGKTSDLVNLLHNFGAQAVTELKPEYYGAFATALREMGAKI